MTNVKTAAIAVACFSFAAAGSAFAQTTATDPTYQPAPMVEQEEDDGMDLGWLGLLGLAGLLGLRRKPADHRVDTTTRPTAR